MISVSSSGAHSSIHLDGRRLSRTFWVPQEMQERPCGPVRGLMEAGKSVNKVIPVVVEPYRDGYRVKVAK